MDLKGLMRLGAVGVFVCGVGFSASAVAQGIPGLDAVDDVAEDVMDEVDDAADEVSGVVEGATGDLNVEDAKAAKNAVHKCTASGKIKLENKTIKTTKDQVAVWAGGDCKVVLRNVTIVGSRGVVFAGSTNVVLDNVKIKTRRSAIKLFGSADVNIKGGRFESTKSKFVVKANGSSNIDAKKAKFVTEGTIFSLTGSSDVDLVNVTMKANRVKAVSGSADISISPDSTFNGVRWSKAKKIKKKVKKNKKK